MSGRVDISSIMDVHTLAAENGTLTVATIELLTKCNWRCQHCYLPSHVDEGLSKNVIFDVLDQLRDLGCFELALTGGEIFYREDCMDIIRKARELGFSVFLLTNISMLDESKIKELADLYISNISCSIFSLDEDIHDSITGVKGSLRKALENIMLIKKFNIPAY